MRMAGGARICAIGHFLEAVNGVAIADRTHWGVCCGQVEEDKMTTFRGDLWEARR